MRVTAKGLVRVYVDGKLVKEVSNLILDSGLAGIASRSWADSFVSCALGTGTTAASAEQTGLETEVRRSVAPISGGTLVSGNWLTLARRWRFGRLPEAATYEELGFSWSPNPGQNLFSRVVTPVVVPAWAELVMQYSVVLVLTPATEVPGAVNADITGSLDQFGSVAGAHNWQSLCLDTVSVSGATVAGDACMEPSRGARIFLSPSAAAPAAFGADVDRSAGIFSKAAAVSVFTPTETGFSLTKSISIAEAEAIMTWRSLGICSQASPGAVNGYVVVFESNKTKSEWATFDLSFTHAWGRG